MSSARAELLAVIAATVPDPARLGRPVRVAVDGVDGSGKTTFADELAAVLRDLDRHVVRVSIDDFHHRRAIRYRRGRDSAEGYWRDAFDVDRFRADVLEPFGPGGTRRFRRAAHELATDTVLDGPYEHAADGTVLLADGVFLHRDELEPFWEFSVYLDVPFTISVPRMGRRDGTAPDPDAPENRRYVDAQRRYLATCRPAERADVVIDNADLDRPRISAGPRPGA